MYAVRDYTQGVDRLVAACDEELLDTKYQEGAFRLDVPSGFYDGARVEAEALLVILRGATIANLVGERTIELAVQNGFVDPDHVRRVEGIPHAQFLILQP